MFAQVRHRLCWLVVVVRGRIELPTFRFSGGCAGPGESVSVCLTGTYGLLGLLGVHGWSHASMTVVIKALARSGLDYQLGN